MYEPKDFASLLGTPGFSDALLNNHFTLYQGYVTNTNALHTTMHELIAAGKITAPEYSEIKRRFGWEFNGMRLHELYFDGMTASPEPLANTSALHGKLVEQFGSFEKWKEIFTRVGSMRGIGWAVLCVDPVSGHLFNIWINEHDVGHLATTTTLLVMDMWEHAYTLDYGIKKADYVDAFVKAIDWNVVASRLN